jgi:hypothetical protein
MGSSRQQIAESFGDPDWYEMYVEVNGREEEIDHEYDSLDELIQTAVELVEGLKGEQDDLGSWSVTVSPHWCDKDSTADCECLTAISEHRVAEFRGETINDLIRRAG